VSRTLVDKCHEGGMKIVMTRLSMSSSKWRSIYKKPL
jgi:hypothetical protein